jgi:uncharacterized protein YbaP (TraB family)
MCLYSNLKSVVLVVVFLASITVNAQQNLEKSLLWKVYGNGVKDTTYLYGTIHAIEKKDFILTKQVKRTFSATESLVMEVPLDMDDATKKGLAKKIMYPSGKSIQHYLSESDYSYYQSYLKDTLKIGVIKAKICDMMLPFFAQSLILMEQLEDMQSYEKSFDKMAKKKEKLAFETIEQQLAIVTGDSVELQVAQFIRDLKLGKLDSKKEFKVMVDLYKAQDLQGLYTYIEKSMSEALTSGDKSGLTREKMLDNRNLNWIPKLEDWMSKKSLFVAIGAGHLAGKNGVIHLLRNKGYKVEPVFN